MQIVRLPESYTSLDDHMTSTDATALLDPILRGYEEGWNQGKLAVLDELLTPDFQGHDPSSSTGVVSRDQVRDILAQIRSAFPDVRREALDHVAAGDRVAVRWRVTGTHRGTFGSIPPTGRRIDVTGITFYRVVHGRIAEEWVQMDGAALNRQLTGSDSAADSS